MTDDIRRSEARLALADVLQDIFDRLEAAWELAELAGGEHTHHIGSLIQQTEAISGVVLAEIQEDILDIA